MNEFSKCNKIIGAYWLKTSIDDYVVRIKIKPVEGIIKLPRFEQYDAINSSTVELGEATSEEYIFKWQEKVFNCHEIEKYSNVHNCVTDTELAYFEQLKNLQCEGKKIFTYINNDCYLPLPCETKKENLSVSRLSSCFEKLNLEGLNKLENVFNKGSSSNTHLFASSEDVSSFTEQWMAMHIVYDNSEYSEDSQLLLKQECILLSLYYNTCKNYLLLSPDCNDVDLNPYLIEGTGLQYAVEVDSGVEKSGEELAMLLSKLLKKWEKKQKNLINFIMPPIGKKKVQVSFEIVSATGFDMDNIYIEYHIKIPDSIKCSNILKGKTHTASALRTEETEEWKYGLIVDLEMEISTGLETPPIKIYLEVISTDWWGRHRTEGYTYLPLTLDPGWYSRSLSCSRPEELDVVEAESRRFFVGGCNLIKDLEVLDNQFQNASYRFASTGTVSVRWSSLAALPMRGMTPVEEALRRYTRAAATLAHASSDL